MSAVAARRSIIAIRSRMATGNVIRRFSDGRVLSEEEKAAENVYIKKSEQEKREKLARQGGASKPGEHAPAREAPAASGANTSGPSASSTAGVSTDKNRNYAVIAGTVALASALGWYFLSPKKTEEPTEDA